MRGTFVVFEGGEGSGKSTQARRLAQRRDALLTRQPGGTKIGGQIRDLLLSPSTVGLDPRAEALLMAADRAQHVAESIRPALEAGTDVICDRYLASSLAYQGAGRNLGVEEVLALSTFAIDGVLPQLTVLLDVPIDVGLHRAGSEPDRLEQESARFHQAVRDAFLELARNDPGGWVVIDASVPIATVSAEVDAAVAERLGW